MVVERLHILELVSTESLLGYQKFNCRTAPSPPLSIYSLFCLLYVIINWMVGKPEFLTVLVPISRGCIVVGQVEPLPYSRPSIDMHLLQCVDMFQVTAPLLTTNLILEDLCILPNVRHRCRW